MNGNPPNYPGQQNFTGGYPQMSQGYQPVGQQAYPQASQPAGQPVYPPQQPYQQMNVNHQPPYQTAQNGYPQQPAYPQQAPQYPPMGQSQQYPPAGQGYQQPYQAAPGAYQQPPQTAYPQQPYPPQFQQQQQRPMNPNYQNMTGINRPVYGNGYQTGYGFPPANQMQEMQQPQPAKPKVDPMAVIKVVLYAGIPALFVLAMLFGGMPVLKWAFVAVAVIALGALWTRSILPENTRFTLTAIYGACAVVALVSALIGAPNDSKTSQNNAGGVAQSGNQSGISQQVAAQTSTPTPSPTPTENINASEIVRQLESFFYFWMNNQVDQMVELCAPSWRASVDSPHNELFVKLSNRKVLEYGNVRVTNGSDNDTTRTVSIDATVSKYVGTDPMTYRFKIVMKQENGQWYIDPNSLDSQEAAEETPTPTPTVSPTPTVYIQVNNSTKLYYNPDGGSKYHADDRCPSAAPKYLPFKGVFTYGELNNSPYASLDPCNRCNAPLRQ